MPSETIENSALREKKTRRFYTDMLLMLVGPAVMAWYYYGAIILKTVFISIASAVVCEFLAGLLLKRKNTLKDLNAIFTGAVIALILPANVSPWLAAAGSAFAIIVAKMPFGGTESTPFMPAAAGFAFLCLSRPAQVFSYPSVGVITDAVVSDGVSLASMLHLNHSVEFNLISMFNVFAGQMAGPMGATCALVLMGCAIFLIIRQPVAAISSAGFVLGSAVMAMIFPRVLNGLMSSVMLELCSGMLLFSALFLITDPAASPKRFSSRFCYGLFAGILCMAMRHFGVFEESACFAVLIASAVWPLITAWAHSTINFFKKIKNTKTHAKGEK